jgi:hypothetical protein
LSGYLEEAIKAHASGDKDLAFFANTVVQNASWNGILAVNVKVPMSDLPPQLAGLAAGIDETKFHAHHMGVNVTPLKMEGSELAIGASSMFGLIDYESEPVQAPPSVPYDYQVEKLKVLFHNSRINSFGCRISLTVNQLFGQNVELLPNPAKASDGVARQLPNTLSIAGQYVAAKDAAGKVHHSYIFNEEGLSIFKVVGQSPVLRHVGVFQVQFNTIVSDKESQATQVAHREIHSKFQFRGTLDFANIDTQNGFDAFSFGAAAETHTANAAEEFAGLSFSQLSVDMSFPADHPNQTTFAFNAKDTGFDTASSQFRAGSLFGHFPLKLVGLRSAADKKSPKQLGYANVDIPPIGSSLKSEWYGLEFDLKLGTLGDLAGKVGMTAKLLVAWSPDPEDQSYSVGIKLPFANGNTIGIQGVLGLTFDQFQFVTNRSGPAAGEVGYVLKLNKITFSFMKKSLPPGGTIGAMVFGDPHAAGKNDTLGWYAAYAKKPPPPPPKKTLLDL